MLSVHQLLDASDLTVCIDNEALYNITTGSLKIKSPTFTDLNEVHMLPLSCASIAHAHL